MERMTALLVVTPSHTRVASETEGNTMKIAILAVCVAATLAAGCRREEAAPMYEPMKLGGATQNEVSR
jgi:hypothetical protein